MIRKDDIISEDVAHVPGVAEEKPIEMSADAQVAEKELEKIASVDEGKPVKTKNTSKNFAMTLLFIAVNVLAVVLTLLMESRDGETAPFSEVWKTYIANFWWLLGAFAMYVLFNAFQAIKRRIFLKSTLNKDLPLISMNATLLCKYYDNITPLGSGGQPFEIYYLRKKGIPVGVASGVPLVSYALDRLAYVVIAFLVLVFYGFGEIGTVLTILCIIGLLINAFIPTALLFFTLLPKTSEKIAGVVAKIGKFLHLVKDADVFAHKLTGSLKEYTECIRYFLKKSGTRMIFGFILSLLSQAALYSIPFFTIRMSGATGINWGEIFALTVICYTSVTLLPTPGNSGGAELSFRSIFAEYLSGGKLFWGIMSWRIFSYYLSIFVGIILIIMQSIYKFTKRGKQERERALKAFENSVIRPKASREEYVDEVAARSENAGGETFGDVVKQKAETTATDTEDTAMTAPPKVVDTAEEGHYSGVVTPAPIITIHDDADEKVVTAETIIPEADNTDCEQAVTADAVETVIHVKAVILPKEGIQVTEISGDDGEETEKCETAEGEEKVDKTGDSSTGKKD